MKLPPKLLRRCIVLAGPTASGKTDVAFEVVDLLARRGVAAEIVALDSMTLYRGMDIGTAKPTAAERDRVPHHLFDVLWPDEEFSVADYLRAAESAVRDIVARGATPLFVGGTGLYLRSLLRGVFEGPPADEVLRVELEAFAADCGNDALHGRLREIDPATADRLHPNDVRRVVRAIEVFEATGRPLSEQQDEGPRPPAERPRGLFWLDRPRAELHARIDTRVDAMLAAGLVEEVRGLLASERPPGKTASQALGYKEVIACLRSECDRAEMTRVLKARTRQFAKRQVTWFRNLEEVEAITADDETATQIARSI